MSRRGDSRSTRALSLIAAAVAVALVAAPTAPAAEPATDEYTLELPGTRDAALGGPGVARGYEIPDAIDQAGVAGEAGPATPSPLGSLGAALSGPLALTLAALLAIACAAIALPRLRPPRTS